MDCGGFQDVVKHRLHFVEAQVRSGRFKNANEVMRAWLRLLEDETALQSNKLALLKKLADEGIRDLNPGRGTEMSSIEEYSDLVAELGQRSSETGASQHPALKITLADAARQDIQDISSLECPWLYLTVIGLQSS